MPYRTTTYTASKRVKPNEPWYIRCDIHGDFDSNVDRCLKCDEDSANYVEDMD